MKMWIFNHYATNQYIDGTGRHQALAKYLIKMGHDVRIFCADTIHNSNDLIDTENKLFTEKKGKDNVDYIFIKTCPYTGNGKARIKNMTLFWRRLPRVVNQYIENEGKPDVFIASSVHPLTLVAGLSLKRKHNIPCICEIRDLWPESIVSYGQARETNPAIKILYKLEKYIYRKADRIVFTMAGGKQYIIDKGWEKQIDLSKVRYICNGIDGELYAQNITENIILDSDLEDDNSYKIVYAGSIRKADEAVPKLVNIAELLKQKELNDIKILVYGDGDIRDELVLECKRKGLMNIVFKGFVDKKYIPFILSKSNLNILNLTDNNILKYGGSQNKLFEYLKSGKPILAGESNPFSIINQYKCGISRKFNDNNEIVDAIQEIRNSNFDEDKIKNAADNFDFSYLAILLEKCIREVVH